MFRELTEVRVGGAGYAAITAISPVTGGTALPDVQMMRCRLQINTSVLNFCHGIEPGSVTALQIPNLETAFILTLVSSAYRQLRVELGNFMADDAVLGARSANALAALAESRTLQVLLNPRDSGSLPVYIPRAVVDNSEVVRSYARDAGYVGNDNFVVLRPTIPEAYIASGKPAWMQDTLANLQTLYSGSL